MQRYKDLSSDVVQESVLATLMYHSVLGMSLCQTAVWRRLIKPNKVGKNSMAGEISLNTVREALQRLEFTHEVVQRDGYYAVVGAETTLKRHLRVAKLIDDKWKYKILSRGRIFLFLPFIENVLVSGSVVMGNVRESSDIDILLIMESGRIWLGRAIVSFVLDVFKLRRVRRRIRNRFCLNHFLTNLSILDTHASLYNAQTYNEVVCIWPKTRFQGAQVGSWIFDYIFQTKYRHTGDIRELKDSMSSRIVSGTIEFICRTVGGNSLESYVRTIQERRIKKHPLTHVRGGRIVYSQQEIEFHPESKERSALNAFNYILRSRGMKYFKDQPDSGLL